jgi:hypothetical protein
MANLYYEIYTHAPTAKSHSFLDLDRIKEYLNVAHTTP